MSNDYRISMLGNILAHVEDLGLMSVPSFSDRKEFALAAERAYRLLWETHEPKYKQRMYYCFAPKWASHVVKSELLGWVPAIEDTSLLISYYREAKQAIFTHKIIENFVKRIGGVEKLPAYGFSATDKKVSEELYYEKPLGYKFPAFQAGFLLARNIDPIEEHDKWCALFWTVVSACNLRAVTAAGLQMKANSLEEIYG